MSYPPSICNVNYPVTNLSSLYDALNANPQVVDELATNYAGLGFDTDINSFNYLVGFQYQSEQPAFFFADSSIKPQLNLNFNVNFMLTAWSIKSNVQALSQLILSMEGAGTAADNIALTVPPQTQLYAFWNSYFDFVFYQFFCLENGLSNTSYVNLIGNNIQSLQIQNLYSLLLTSQNGGNGFGSGGTGTSRMCQFCASFWGTDTSQIRKTIVSNPALNKFCGCCDGIPLLNFGTNGPVQPPLRCQPICSNPNTIRAYAGPSTLVNNSNDLTYQNKNSDFYSDVQAGFFMPYTCPNQTICIMDKLNIQVAGFNNQLDFNQVCPGCTNGECECFIDSGSNVIENMGANGVGMSDPEVFNQNCGLGAVCFNLQGDGNRTEVKCNTNNVANTSKYPDINYNGSGQNNYLNSITDTNAYAFGINNIIFPVVFFVIILIYLLLTTIDIVSHLKRLYKIKH